MTLEVPAKNKMRYQSICSFEIRAIHILTQVQSCRAFRVPQKKAVLRFPNKYTD